MSDDFEVWADLDTWFTSPDFTHSEVEIVDVPSRPCLR